MKVTWPVSDAGPRVMPAAASAAACVRGGSTAAAPSSRGRRRGPAGRWRRACKLPSTGGGGGCAPGGSAACPRACTVQRLLRLIAADVGEIAARHRERHVDRRQLVDHHHRVGVVGANQVALVHAERSGPSADRRDDVRVLQVQLRGLDRRLVGFDRRLGRFRRRDLRFVLIARDELPLVEVLVVRALPLRRCSPWPCRGVRTAWACASAA